MNMQRKLYKVHRLVAESFVKKPKTEKTLQIDHIDRNKMNNDSKNLRWVTAAENRKNSGDRAKYQTHAGKKIKRICVETGEEVVFKTLTEAAQSVKMGLSTIRERLQSGSPTKNGYKFIYIE